MNRQVSRTPARFPSGVNNTINGANPNYLYHALGMLDPWRYQVDHEDFFKYAAGDWTITAVGSTGDAVALTAADGGALLITTGTDNPSSKYFQRVALCQYPVVGSKLWFEIAFKTGSGTVTLPDIVFGLQSLDTTPLAVADGIYFIQTHGAATVDFLVKSAATSATTTVSAVGTLVASTAYRYGFYYNGADEIQYFINGVKVGTTVTTNLPVVGLTPSFGINATTAAAQTLQIGHITVIKERTWPNNPA